MLFNQSTRILGVSVLLTVALVPNVGLADGWTWGPFSKSEASRDSSPLYSNANKSKSSWLPTMKWPRMPGANSGPRTTSYSRSNTSTWGKMSKTSKRWFSKTAEMLDPYPDPKPSTYYSSSSESQKSNGGWFKGWFEKKDSDVPKTANDFLGRPKIQ